MKTIFIIIIVIGCIWLVASTTLWLIIALVDHKKPKLKDWFVSLLMPIGLLHKLFKK
jgi:hypothetical protein